MLRLIEHGDKLEDFDELAEFSFPDPVEAVRRFDTDLAGVVTQKTHAGSEYTALDYQESLIEYAEELAEIIELPDDELEALVIWRNIVDRMRTISPDDLAFNGLEYELDVVARYVVLAKKVGQDALNSQNAQAQQISLKWDQVNPMGIAQGWWQRHHSSAVTNEDIESARTVPAETRASYRTDIIEELGDSVSVMTWSQANFNDGSDPIDLSDPYFMDE